MFFLKMFCRSTGVLPAIWRFKREVRCTLTPRENRERAESGIFFKIIKKTQTPCTWIPVEKSECWYLAYVVVWENKSEISNAYLVQLLFIMSFIGMSRTCAFITFIRPCRIQFTICVNRHFKERSLYTFPNNNSN